jgi:hypothetical protein
MVEARRRRVAGVREALLVAIGIAVASRAHLRGPAPHRVRSGLLSAWRRRIRRDRAACSLFVVHLPARGGVALSMVAL